MVSVHDLPIKLWYKIYQNLDYSEIVSARNLPFSKEYLLDNYDNGGNIELLFTWLNTSSKGREEFCTLLGKEGKEMYCWANKIMSKSQIVEYRICGKCNRIDTQYLICGCDICVCSNCGINLKRERSKEEISVCEDCVDDIMKQEFNKNPKPHTFRWIRQINKRNRRNIYSGYMRNRMLFDLYPEYMYHSASKFFDMNKIRELIFVQCGRARGDFTKSLNNFKGFADDGKLI